MNNFLQEMFLSTNSNFCESNFSGYMTAFFVLQLSWHTIPVLLLLAGSLFVSVGIALFHIYRYNIVGSLPLKFIWTENQNLEKVQAKISTEKLLLAPGEVFDSDVLNEIKKIPNKKSLIFDRLITIINLQKSYARIDLEVLQAATQTKESASRTLEIPGYFVGLAMLVGLLGTIIGLSIMVGNMQDTINLSLQSAVDFSSKNREKVQDVLGSMQSAFWTTIGGLFCSIVSSLLNYFMRISQARFYERLDTFTVEELLPWVFRSKETSALLKDANENIEKTFSKLQNIGQNILDNTQKLNAVHESFNTIITNLEKMSQNPLRNEMQQIFQQLSLAITETARTNQFVQNTVQYIPQVIELMERNNDQNLQALNQVLQKNKSWQETAPGISYPTPRVSEIPPNWKTQIQHPEPGNKLSGKTNLGNSLMEDSRTRIVAASVLGIGVLFFIIWFFSN